MVTLEDAQSLTRKGLAVIPVQPETKKPACATWRQFQEYRPDDATIREWFQDNKQQGVAVLCGAVSGNLVVRDFDDVDAYNRWSNGHPDLASSLPTVETPRPGRHVYLKGDSDYVRRRSPSGGGVLYLGDGELRAADCYCVAPPTDKYMWLIEIGNDIPGVDLASSGLIERSTETTRDSGVSELAELSAPTGLSAPAEPSVLRDIEQAINHTQPKGVGERHHKLFELARHLKAISDLADLPVSELKWVIGAWHTKAVPVIRTKPFEESWLDFAQAWQRVRYAKGEGPIAMLLARARESDVPAEAENYDQPDIRLLAAFCRELQRASGSDSFFLSSHTYGELLGVNHGVVWRWLKILDLDGIISVVSKGSHARRKANEYRYCFPLNQT